MLQVWSLTHSLKGTFVSVDEVPFPAWAAQQAGDWLCWMTEKVTGVCMIAPPGWMFALRWGRRDDEGYTARCAGHYVWKFGNALCSGFGMWHRQKTIALLPVTYEWVREFQPDAGWPWDGSDFDAGEENL